MTPIPKQNAWRSEAYRRLVSSLPCAHCGKHAPSQAAHADAGKGMGIKSDDRTCFPACADSPGRRGCHSILGASGMFSREQRRVIEQNHARKTRERIRNQGLWLPSWPDYEEQE